MTVTREELDAVEELAESNTDALKEVIITQNALLTVLMQKGFIGSEEFEAARSKIADEINGA